MYFDNASDVPYWLIYIKQVFTGVVLNNRRVALKVKDPYANLH